MFGSIFPKEIKLPSFNPSEIPKIKNLDKLILKGRIVLPQDQDYNLLRIPFNYDVCGTPSAIILVKDEQDIVNVVKFANENNLNLAVSAGKHSYYSSVSNVIVVDLKLLQEVVVDSVDKIVTCQTGVKLERLDAVCKPFGLAFTCGTNPDTGVAGLSLGFLLFN